MKQYKPYILFILLFVLFLNTRAQEKEQKAPTTRILFVFDASQSMLGTWESDKKINIARKYLISIIDSLEQLDNVQMALRIYGHQSPVPPQDCSDTKLEVPFTDNNASRIRQKLRYIIPKGTTPIAYSLEQSEKDFPKCKNCRNIIILITDGIEACEGDPCEVSRKLQKKGIVLKPFVIGIGYDPHFKETFDCIGHFYNTPNEDKFKEVLGVVISRALNSTTAQVNLLDENNRPTETNVNMTFYDNFSGKIKYNFVHTINYMGNPDTLILDPLIIYDVVAHTTPSRRTDSITLTSGKHTNIGIKVPQGYIKISCPRSYQYRDLPILIKENNKAEILTVQTLNNTKKLLTGLYDLEVLSLPRIIIKDVDIQQSKTTTINIPRPGIANFLLASSGYASLYNIKNDSLIHIYDFDTNITRKSLVLQPGNYKVVFRAKKIKESIYTITKNFKITSGASNSIILH